MLPLWYKDSYNNKNTCLGDIFVSESFCSCLYYSLQKLMIDEKKCYFFGRNKQLCDFRIDHASCSRVHAALVWHKHLTRPFLIDLGSSEYSNHYYRLVSETIRVLEKYCES